MSAHCEWCADPWRQTLIALAKAGLRIGVIIRHYGLRHSTVSQVLVEARQRECLPWSTCKNCGLRVKATQIVCAKQACQSRRDRDSTRLRRARYGHKRKGPVKRHGGIEEPVGFVWPELPPNPRERRERVPNPVIGAPIIHPASMLGVGNRRKSEQEAALALHAEHLKRQAMPVLALPVQKRPAVTPFRPLAVPQPVAVNFWTATRTVNASGRVRPASAYVIAPPLCPTLGSLHHGRMAA